MRIWSYVERPGGRGPGEEAHVFPCGDVLEDCKDDVNNVEHDDDQQHDGRHYLDDTSGSILDPKLTKEARQEEIEAIHDMIVYRKVPIALCLEETGKRPIGTRWVDTNKGNKLCLKIRSRLVAQEINRSKLPELFTATPPLEFVKYFISLCASSQWTSQPTPIMSTEEIDVRFQNFDNIQKFNNLLCKMNNF